MTPTAGGPVAARHLLRLFQPDDTAALTLINQRRGHVAQRIAPVRRIVSPRGQAWLRHMNTDGYDVYCTVNTLVLAARRRLKSSIDEIRHLYLDFDDDAPAALCRLFTRSDLPRPHYVVNTSPGKFQVLWRVSGFTLTAAERLLRALARNTGADVAAADASRVLRVPGFQNHKYTPPHLVTVEVLYESILTPAAFPDLTDSVYPIPVARRTPYTAAYSAAADNTRSGRDWRCTLSRLRRGADPQQLICRIGSRAQR